MVPHLRLGVGPNHYRPQVPRMYMRVPGDQPQGAPSPQFLHRPEIHASHHEPPGKRVPRQDCHVIPSSHPCCPSRQSSLYKRLRARGHRVGSLQPGSATARHGT